MTTDREPVSVPWPHRPLERAAYHRPTAATARWLLGKALVSNVGGALTGGVIVETEAYLATGDPASHSHRGETVRNRSMFARPGTLYVYSIHARWCLNAVTGPEGAGTAVLIRALEPVWGLDVMRQRRGLDDLRRLSRGPAMLCQALGVEGRHDGADLTTPDQVWIGELAHHPLPEFSVAVSPRIGIRHAAELPLRFFVDGNRFVSGRARDHGRPPRNSFFHD